MNKKRKMRPLTNLIAVVLVAALFIVSGLTVFADEAPTPEEPAAITTTDGDTQPDGNTTPDPAVEPDTAPPVTVGTQDETAWAVTFKDNDLFGGGLIGQTQQVRSGEAAVAPTVPQHEGYRFTGWSPADLSNIQGDTTFTAQYEALVKYTVTINYVIEGEPALAPPAKVIEAYPGLAEIITVDSPVIKGYQPDQASISVDTAQLTGNASHTVTYQRSDLVAYQVKHYLPSLSNPQDLQQAKLVHTETLYGKTEDKVEAVAREYPGFSAPEKMPSGLIPADMGDESFELHVYYLRNEYTLRFVSEEDGEEAELHTITMPYGTPIDDSEKPADPARAGYLFEGWTVDGESADIPETIPAGNITFTAQWFEISEASFTVNAFLQNPDNWDEYLPIGEYSLTGIVGKTPEIKITNDAKKLGFPDFAPFEWEDYFTLNEEKTNLANADIIVKSDKSTVANVYFDRITFEFILRVHPEPFLNSYGEAIQYDASMFDFDCGNGAHSSGSHVCFSAKLGQDISNPLVGIKPLPNSTASDAQKAIVQNGWRIVAPGQKYGQTIGLNSKYVVHINWLRSARAIAPNHQYYIEAVPKVADIAYARFPIYVKSEQLDGTLTADPTRYANVALLEPRIENGMVVGWGSYGSTSFTKKAGFTAYYDDGTPMNWTNCWMSHYKLKTPISLENYNNMSLAQIKKLAETGLVGRTSKNLPTPQFQTINFKRNSYGLTLNNVGNSQKEFTVKYEEKLANALAGFVPTAPQGYAGYSFEGWYSNAARTKKVNLETTGMPANSMMLYAKWVPNLYSVTFNLDGGQLDGKDLTPAPQQVEAGQQAQEPAGAFTKDGYLFDGWLVAGTASKYSFGTRIAGNLELVAKWAPRNDISYTIQYCIAGEDEPWNTVTKNDGEMGGSITENAVFYKDGYFPDALSKWRRLTQNGNDNIIVFEYTQLESVEYTVRHMDSNGELLQQEKKSSSNVSVTENSKAIEGYTVQTNQKALMLTSDPSRNVIVFVYKQNLPADYSIVHYVQLEDKTGYEEADTEQASAPIGTTVYASPETFDGYKLNRSISRTWDAVKADGSTQLSLYYDLETTPGSEPSNPGGGSKPEGGTPTPGGDTSQPAGTPETTPAAVTPPADAGRPAAPTGARPALPASPEAEREITRNLLKEQNVPTVGLGNNEVPLYGTNNTQVWALLNLMLAIGGLLYTAAMGIVWVLRRKNSQQFEVNRAFRALAMVAGIGALLLFVITQDLSALMVLADKWTIWMAVITVVQVATGVLGRFRRAAAVEEIPSNQASV